MQRKPPRARTRGTVGGVGFEIGSGNVFADLRFPDAAERQTKARLAAEIAILLDGVSQKEAAVLLGVDQPKISKLLRGQLRGFSTERLMWFLTLLGQNVEIRISPVARLRATGTRPGHISVFVA